MTTLYRLLKTEIGEQGGGFTGTAVDPTAKLMGVTGVDIDPGVTSVPLTDEQRGTLFPAYLGYVESVIPKVTVTGYLFPEDAPYFFNGLFSKATATGGGGGTIPWTRTYLGSGTVTSSAAAYTLVRGQISDKIYGVRGFMPNKLNIKLTNGKPWMYTIEGIGYVVLSDAFGTSLADRTMTVATASSTTIYMDAAGGTIGSTAMSATAFEAEINLENGRTGDQYIGALLLGGQHENQWSGSLKLTAELNATSDELQEDQLSLTPANQQRLFRFKYDNGVTDQTQRQIQLDMGMFAEKTPVLFRDKGGLATLEWEGTGMYDSGAFAQWLKATVINNTQTMA